MEDVRPVWVDAHTVGVQHIGGIATGLAELVNQQHPQSGISQLAGTGGTGKTMAT